MHEGNPLESGEYRGLGRRERETVRAAARPGARGTYGWLGGTSVIDNAVGLSHGVSSGRKARARAASDLAAGRTNVHDENVILESASTGWRGFGGHMLGGAIGGVLGGGNAAVASRTSGAMATLGRTIGVHSADLKRNRTRAGITGRDAEKMASFADAVMRGREIVG